MTLTKCKQHISMCSVALGSFQSSVFGSAAVTLLALLNLLATRRSQCQQRVGVLFSSERFCIKIPRPCSCLALAHWSLQIFSLTQEQWGINTNVIFWITSKEMISAQQSRWETAGPILHIFRSSLLYHHFASTAHLILNFSAQALKLKLTTSEFLTLNLGRTCLTSML